MKYYQDPVNGKFYSEDEEEKKLYALELQQKRKRDEAKLATLIWFINGVLIGWLIVFWGLRCIW